MALLVYSHLIAQRLTLILNGALITPMACKLSKPIWVLAAVLLTGCGSGASPTRQPESPTHRAPIPALIKNTPVGWDSLNRSMAELSGRRALEEYALDLALRQSMRLGGLTLTEDMVNQERDWLNESLTDSSQHIDTVLRGRGLGPVRLKALLRRNAMLRALVGEIPAPDENELRHAFEIKHAPRRVCRVLLTTSVSQAGEILERLLTTSHAQGLEWAFAQEAFDHSTDPSAAAGGLIGAIHPLDGFLPESVSAAIVSTPDGEISGVVLISGGAAIVMPVGTTQGDGVGFEDVEVSLGDELTKQRQRLAMDTLARTILSETEPVILDPSLNWSWGR